MIKHLKEGDGDSPGASSVVRVHYTGTLPDGSVFDSSVKRGEPVEFPLNAVVAGWTEGIQLMKVGGKAKLTIPAALGYGDAGKATIPPKATLIFEVELLDIVSIGKGDAAEESSEERRSPSKASPSSRHLVRAQSKRSASSALVSTSTDAVWTVCKDRGMVQDTCGIRNCVSRRERRVPTAVPACRAGEPVAGRRSVHALSMALSNLTPAMPACSCRSRVGVPFIRYHLSKTKLICTNGK